MDGESTTFTQASFVLSGSRFSKLRRMLWSNSGIFDGNATENDGNVGDGRASDLINTANPESGSLSPTPPPPVPPFTLSNLTRHISQEELFPIKVAYNVGETNWEEATNLCTTVAYYPVLLLDWLEHLVELMLDADVVDAVTAHDGESNAVKASKALHRLLLYVGRSLDRLLSCLRVLQKKVGLIEGGIGVSFANGISDVALFDAVRSRAAMAIFHISSSSSTSLNKHADFIAMLVRDWHAPKRLELNLESLQKLGKSPSARRLSHSGSKILDHGLASPKSPRVGDHYANLEPAHPRPTPTGDHFPKPKETHDSPSPVKIEPLNLHPRVPSEQGASPVKIEMPLPSHRSPDPRKEIDVSSVAAAPGSPSRSVSMSEKESEMTCSVSATSPTCGLGNSSSACSLPSVRGGDRYKNKH